MARKRSMQAILKNPLPSVPGVPQLRDYSSDVPGAPTSNLGKKTRYGSPAHSPAQRDTQITQRRLDYEHAANSERPTFKRIWHIEQAKKDGIGEMISSGGMTHMGRRVTFASPAGSPMSGDPGAALIRGAAGAGVDGPNANTLSANLRNARGGRTSAVGVPG